MSVYICDYVYTCYNLVYGLKFMIAVMRERRDIKPVLLKFGAALALSLGGAIYSFIRTNRIKRSDQSPSPDSVHKNDLRRISSCCGDALDEAGKQEESCLSKVIIEDTNSNHSPDFHELVKEFDLSNSSPKKDVETRRSDFDAPSGNISLGNDCAEQEIKNLKNTVRILHEREKVLEIQLLEYYGLKEQETAFMELQNRLKINTMESKLFTLKIESLQAENRRLQSQLADQSRVVAELEVARAKIKFLKTKLRSEAEQTKEQIIILQQRVAKLHNQELKLQKLKDLEEEAEELRKSNYSLRVENSNLAHRLESTQVLANSILEDHEFQTEALKEEALRLRQENEDLSKQIEQLQADRCADAEELVYLRWINACLRYELRNYRPGHGKTVARDLSKTLSPKSEEKAKQLILEYANKEGLEERNITVTEFDSGRWSSSQASYVTDEFDDSSVDNSSANKTTTSSKTKIFAKLRRLLLGKDKRRRSRGSSVETNASTEDIESGECLQTDSIRMRSSSQCSSRHSVDLPDLPRSRSGKVDETKDKDSVHKNNEDVASSGVYKILVRRKEGDNESLQGNQVDDDTDSAQRADLFKYAEALKESQATESNFRKRSPAYRSY